MPITASMLYDLIACPHRVSMDLFGDPAERDEVSPFIKMLWEKGASHEVSIMAEIGVPFLDLSGFHGAEKERLTTEAISRWVPLIYGGRITAGDLVGEPDLLRLEPGMLSAHEYLAGDIKSGAGEEGREDLSKPKLHYAVQLALYVDILEEKGLSAGRTPFIIDINGEEFFYGLDDPYGQRNPTTLWTEYQEALAQARAIVSRQMETLGAYRSTCKLCWWYSACSNKLEEADDLTLLPELGRSKRDVMLDRIGTIAEFAATNVEAFIDKKKTAFKGIGPDVLRKLHERAKLVTSANPQPYLSAPLTLPHSEIEVFFDIETDPMRDFCYLHGMLERRDGDNGTERFDAFFSDDLSPSQSVRHLLPHGTTCGLDQQPSSTTIPSTSELSGGRCSRNIPMSALPMRSRHCFIPPGWSISTSMWCRRQRCGPPVITRSRHWRSSWASSGVIRIPRALRQSSGSISGYAPAIQLFVNKSSITTRTIVLPQEFCWME